MATDSIGRIIRLTEEEKETLRKIISGEIETRPARSDTPEPKFSSGNEWRPGRHW